MPPVAGLPPLLLAMTVPDCGVPAAPNSTVMLLSGVFHALPNCRAFQLLPVLHLLSPLSLVQRTLVAAAGRAVRSATDHADQCIRRVANVSHNRSAPGSAVT